MLAVEAFESLDDVELCPFCGKALHMQWLNILGEKCSLGRELCTCEQSKRIREIERTRMEVSEQQERSEELGRRINRQQVKAGVGSKYFKCTQPSKYTNHDECLQSIFSFTENIKRGQQNEKPWLFISGGYGTGKTSLASAIIYHIIADQERKIMEKKARKRKKMFFLTPSDMFRDLLLAFKDEKVSSVEVFDKYSTCDILVLDDFAKASSSNFKVDALFDILDARDKNQLTTIFTSNTDLGEGLLEKLRPKAGDYDAARAILSRMIGNCLIVNMNGEDKRMST